MKKIKKTTKNTATNGEPKNKAERKSNPSVSLKSRSEKSEYLTEDIYDEGSLNGLYVDPLKDVSGSEKYLVNKLPISENIATKILQKAIQNHWEITKKHVSKVEQDYKFCSKEAVSKKFIPIQGLVEEVEELIDQTDDKTLTRDAGLKIGSQKVEHYEIAGYGGVAVLSQVLGNKEASKILIQILKEEKEVDGTLVGYPQNKIKKVDAATE